jgi:putative membrane protein
MMGWYVGDHMTGWGWAGMTLSTVLFVGLLVLGGLFLVRIARQSERAHTPPSAEHLLGERYARGDIDEEEYRRRLATLTDTGALSR